MAVTNVIKTVSSASGWKDEEIRRTLDNIEQGPLHLERRGIARALGVVVANFNELLALLNLHCSPEAAGGFQSHSYRHLYSAALVKLAQRLHNYLAAVYTCRERLERVLCHLPELKKIYRSEADASFTKNPRAAFFHDLRNFVIHRELPRFTSTWSRHLSSGHTRSALYMDVKSLKLSGWDWSAGAKRFLARRKNIDLLHEIKVFHKDIVRFDTWFLDQLDQAIERQDPSFRETVIRLRKASRSQRSQRMLQWMQSVESGHVSPDNLVATEAFNGECVSIEEWAHFMSIESPIARGRAAVNLLQLRQGELTRRLLAAYRRFPWARFQSVSKPPNSELWGGVEASQLCDW